MKYFFLVWAGLWRRRVRTLLTLLSATVAFFLFGVLQGVDSSIKQLADRAHLDLLVTTNPALIPLPLAYLSQIEAIPGTIGVSYASTMGAYYRTPRNQFVVLATDPTRHEIFQDWIASQSDWKAFANTRIGALVASSLARKYSWKRGDLISVHTSAMPKQDGSSDWSIQIVGFFDVSTNADAPLILINYAYFDAARSTNKGTVQEFMTHIRDPSQAGGISNAIDGFFENSPAQTRTLSQKDLAQSQLAQVGDIDFLIDAIVGAAFFTLLLLVGNALMQSFRERTREFAVMKTLGFSDAKVATLVMCEALLLCILASAIGLLLARAAMPLIGSATDGTLPAHLSVMVVAVGLSAAVLVGIISGSVPAWKSNRLTIVSALATH